MIKIEEPKIIPIQVKAEEKLDEIEKQARQEQPYQESTNVIVIPQEYKFKSPAKYSFK